jgi:hypothetical protein
MPTHRTFPDANQDPVQLRNLLDDAQSQLEELDLRTPAIRELLAPARQLVEDSAFWRNNDADGLALFIAPDYFRAFRLPYGCPQGVDLAQTPYLNPLLHALLWDIQFVLMAISPKAVRLYRCTQREAVPIELPAGVPRNYEDTQGGREVEQSLQHHTVGNLGRAGFAAAAHSHAPEDLRKPLLLDYLQVMSRYLEPLLRREGLPVVVAAVDYLHPMCREAFQSTDLLEPGVVGSPDELTESEMLERAWPIVEAKSKQERQQEADMYDELLGSERATDRLDDILLATVLGRVQTLFVSLWCRAWGTFDTTTGETKTRDHRVAGDVDLIDLAAKQTIRQRGKVFVVDRDEMPHKQSVAAVLRW